MFVSESFNVLSEHVIFFQKRFFILAVMECMMWRESSTRLDLAKRRVLSVKCFDEESFFGLPDFAR